MTNTFRRRHVSPASCHGATSSDSTPGLTRRNGVFRYVHIGHPAEYASCKSLQGLSRARPWTDIPALTECCKYLANFRLLARALFRPDPSPSKLTAITRVR